MSVGNSPKFYKTFRQVLIQNSLRATQKVCMERVPPDGTSGGRATNPGVGGKLPRRESKPVSLLTLFKLALDPMTRAERAVERSERQRIAKDWPE